LAEQKIIILRQEHLVFQSFGASCWMHRL